jgi:hypothetical protein
VKKLEITSRDGKKAYIGAPSEMSRKAKKSGFITVTESFTTSQMNMRSITLSPWALMDRMMLLISGHSLTSRIRGMLMLKTGLRIIFIDSSAQERSHSNRSIGNRS